MARPARAPSAAALMANCTSRETSPATYTPGILVPPFSSQFDALLAVAAPELLKQGRAGMPPGIEEERPPVEATAIDKTDGSCPKPWCKSVGHGLSSMLARAARHAAGMRRGRACGSSLNWASFSRLM